MKQESNQAIKHWRAPRIVLMIFLVFMLSLIGRLTYLSLSDTIYGTDLRAFAENRATVNRTLFARRGTIYDSSGNPLALNVTSYTLYAYLEPSRTTNIDRPNHVVDVERTATELGELIGAPYEYMVSRLNANAYQVEFGVYGSRLTELKKLAIEELELPGIGFIESSKRFYPNGSFASYILGYARVNDDGVIVGNLGIERRYNEVLTGTNGNIRYQRDLSGFQIPDTPVIRTDAINGSDIYLTVDATIQRFLESAVRDAVVAQRPEWMIMTIMDAKTGAILGSATSPSFDPNNLPPGMSYQNPLHSLAYEPGSVMKSFTYLCAIDTGRYDGGQLFRSGSMTVPGATVNDWRPEGWGMISFDVGYKWSSNVGSMQLARQVLTPNELRECFISYGFGRPTGIELSNEASGSIAFDGRIEIDWLASTYGQGISSTPVQLLQALTIIANDGYMVRPHLISKIVDGETGEEFYHTPQRERITSSEAAKKMRELMDGAVNIPGFPPHPFHMDDIHLIGKTGTAQIFEGGRYLLGQYMLSFTGMFPAEDPEIIIYVAYSKPASRFHRQLAVPTHEVIRNIAKYLNMQTDDPFESSVNSYVMSNYINQDVYEVKETLTNMGLRVVVIGDGDTVVNQRPSLGTTIVTGDRILLVTNSKNITMENVIGWTRVEFETYMRLIGTPYRINGFGSVVEQTIPPGTEINRDMLIEVILRSRFDEEEIIE